MQNTGVEIIEKPKLEFVSGVKKYAQLRKDITEAGVLQRSYFYYLTLATISILGFFLSAINLVITAQPLYLTFLVIAFIFFTVQIAGLMHDSGHRAIFKSTKVNDAFGFFVSNIINFSYCYWKFKHNKHHANPNVIDEDPDVDIPLLSFTKNKKHANFLTKFLVKYQAFLYYPLGSLVSFYERYKGFEYMKNNQGLKNSLEMATFLFSTFFWFVLPFFLMSPTKALILITAVNLGNGIYLANIFAPNHKGMPQYKKGTRVSFLEQQILTARNIKGNWLLDTLCISLNYQTEHHLFPNCPRHKLKLITPYLQKICQQTGLKYTETNILQSNKIILKELHSVSQFA